MTTENSFTIGDVATDRNPAEHGDNDERLLVVGLPDEPAKDYVVDWDYKQNEITVVDRNDDCDPDDDVIEVIYYSRLFDRFPEWQQKDMEYIHELIDKQKLSPYGFPSKRLEKTTDSAFN